MKYLKYLLVSGLILISTSSYTTRTSGLSEGLSKGSLIPVFTLYDEWGNEFDLSQLKGQKVILNLWAAYDAKSHMQNVLLSNVLKKEDYPVKMVSVSFDNSKSVFETTLQMDGIDRNLQFIDTHGENSQLYKKYRLNNGFNSYLLDEHGMIIAVNPTVDDLKRMYSE